MQKPPQLLPTRLEDAQAPGIRYRIDGELVPVLHTWLDGSVPVFFEHHVVLWKDPPLNIGIRAMKGAFKRMVAGMPIFLTEAQGPGEIAYSRDGAGHLFPLHLMPGTAVLVREHQFLAATGNLDYTFNRVKGVSNMLFGSTGFFVDRFSAGHQEGVLWLHGYGNVFQKIKLFITELLESLLYADKATHQTTSKTGPGNHQSISTQDSESEDGDNQ